MQIQRKTVRLGARIGMLLTLLVSCAAPAAHHEGPPAAEVVLDRTLLFAGTGGEDVSLSEGRYRVEAGEGALSLVAVEGGEVFALSAAQDEHDAELDGPMVLAVPEGVDAVNLVLLLPGGTRLVAQGSESGVRERAAMTSTYSAQALMVRVMQESYAEQTRDREMLRAKQRIAQQNLEKKRREAAARARASSSGSACSSNAQGARNVCRSGCAATANSSCTANCASCFGYAPCVSSCMQSCVSAVADTCRGGCDVAYDTALRVCGAR